MKFKKYFVYLLLLIFSFPAIMSMSSCSPSYRNVHRISKNKKMQSKRSRSYKRKATAKAKKSGPINTAYKVRAKRRNTFHY
ncbi:MAG: hypothetical protein II757_06085 [Bacteroidales bacterium]|jgi:hypothetical protein|nr:hypothetical protein [Bacteroidales bacterium]